MGEKKSQIFRYIRLTELIVALLDKVDAKKLAFNPAVELSYLSIPEQTAVADAMARHEVKPSLSQAVRLKKLKQAEAHNIPVRELREAESQARHDAAREHEKQVAAEKQEIFDARVDEIAKAIERGENVKVGYDACISYSKNHPGNII